MRRYFRQLRDAMAPEEKTRAEAAICLQLKETLLTWKARRIHTFLPMDEEVNIWPVIRWALGAGIELSVPKTLADRKLEHLVLKDPDDLASGVFGTSHPRVEIIDSGPYDVILVPGLAFDPQGNRLGYGAGYYDHFLVDHPSAIKVGICFAEQIADFVPHDAHDIPVDTVISELGLYSDQIH
ncbi:MAG TPA: 5-formyltetrahydrofolate cyclo-ligase [Saprospiraceae bacterium]|nr:5-formyltetrahydrofolate cyclo-ligase [Saprospiraceae bacterium]